MKINCIVIEDEPLAAKKIKELIKQVDYLNLLKTFDNAVDAIGYLKQNRINLIFLDIRMKRLSGIQFLEVIQTRPKVIITTAYDEYALKGYELDITDYLLKPIRFERFLKAVNKANALCASVPNQLEPDHIYVKSEYQTIKILLNDILYIEGLKDYVKIHTVDKTIITRLNVKGINAKLPSNQFVRIHRSFIVSLSKIDTFQKQQIRIGNTEIPIGDAYSNEFKKHL